MHFQKTPLLYRIENYFCCQVRANQSWGCFTNREFFLTFDWVIVDLKMPISPMHLFPIIFLLVFMTQLNVWLKRFFWYHRSRVEMFSRATISWKKIQMSWNSFCEKSWPPCKMFFTFDSYDSLFYSGRMFLMKILWSGSMLHHMGRPLSTDPYSILLIATPATIWYLLCKIQ